MSITKPQGFLAAGIYCGIKADTNALDLALVALDQSPQSQSSGIGATAVFTTNKVEAAPVLVSKQHLKASNCQIKAVVLSSGCANAATGEQGTQDAIAMCERVAVELKFQPEEVLVCSTGLIGYVLPIDNVLVGIGKVAGELSIEGHANAAKAIMTTDTKPKEHVEVGDGFIVGGMAKGAAMLAPQMEVPKSATMLAVITTDAACPQTDLTHILQTAVDESFNKLSVDGVQSTNDTVILLSSGLAGEKPVEAIQEAVQKTCKELAYMMASDAEGGTKVVKINISGALGQQEANRAARYLADSLLLKCSWYGQDPYWGRLASEVGASGVQMNYDKLAFSYGEITVFEEGQVLTLSDAQNKELTEYMSNDHIDIYIELGVGDSKSYILTSDLGHGYIDENSKTS